MLLKQYALKVTVNINIDKGPQMHSAASLWQVDFGSSQVRRIPLRCRLRRAGNCPCSDAEPFKRKRQAGLSSEFYWGSQFTIGEEDRDTQLLMILSYLWWGQEKHQFWLQARKLWRTEYVTIITVFLLKGGMGGEDRRGIQNKRGVLGDFGRFKCQCQLKGAFEITPIFSNCG